MDTKYNYLYYLFNFYTFVNLVLSITSFTFSGIYFSSVKSPLLLVEFILTCGFIYFISSILTFSISKNLKQKNYSKLEYFLFFIFYFIILVWCLKIYSNLNTKYLEYYKSNLHNLYILFIAVFWYEIFLSIFFFVIVFSVIFKCCISIFCVNNNQSHLTITVQPSNVNWVQVYNNLQLYNQYTHEITINSNNN